MESIDRADPEVHSDIVHALVNVKAAIVDFVDVFALELHAPAVLNEVRNNKITRVVRALLAERHKEGGVSGRYNAHAKQCHNGKPAHRFIAQNKQDSGNERGGKRNTAAHVKAVLVLLTEKSEAGKGAVGILAFREQPYRQSDGQSDEKAPDPAPAPVDLGILKAFCGYKHHHKHRHIEPARIISVVKGRE